MIDGSEIPRWKPCLEEVETQDSYCDTCVGRISKVIKEYIENGYVRRCEIIRYFCVTSKEWFWKTALGDVIQGLRIARWNCREEVQEPGGICSKCSEGVRSHPEFLLLFDDAGLRRPRKLQRRPCVAKAEWFQETRLGKLLAENKNCKMFVEGENDFCYACFMKVKDQHEFQLWHPVCIRGNPGYKQTFLGYHHSYRWVETFVKRNCENLVRSEGDLCRDCENYIDSCGITIKVWFTRSFNKVGSGPTGYWTASKTDRGDPYGGSKNFRFLKK
jgi:hypothetical protein